MNKRTKIWLIAAASLVMLGGIMFVSVMTAFNWDFSKLSTVKYETNTYYLSDDFNSISIKDDTADISFIPSNDGKIRVVCHEEKNTKHSVEVQNGTLSIKLTNNKKWYEHIGINFGSPKITVYIPEGEYSKLTISSSTSDVSLPNSFKFESISVSVSTGDVKILSSALNEIKVKTSTGNICLESLSAHSIDLTASTGKVTASDINCEGDMKIKVSTGKTEISNITCKSLTTDGSTGNISMKDVLAKEKFSVKRSTGDIKFENCDASEIFIETDTGDVKGSLLSDKVFIAKTDTGRIDVPKTVTGGRCEITTDTGNIIITINYRTDPA